MGQNASGPAEPAAEDVLAEFPGWILDDVAGGLICAHRLVPATSPPVSVKAENGRELRDQIRRAEARLRQQRPEAWRS